MSPPSLPKFLLSSSPTVSLEFAKAAADNILKGERVVRDYRKHGNELQVTIDVMDEAVQMLSRIYIMGAQTNVSTIEMDESLIRLGFERTARKCLVEQFSLRGKEIRDLVEHPRLHVPSYKKLEWRLDIQIASRSLLRQSNPSFLLKLSLNPPRIDQILSSSHGKRDTRCREVYFEADYCTLKAICTSLERALAACRITKNTG